MSRKKQPTRYFGILVVCQRVLAESGNVLTEEGERRWLVEEEWVDYSAVTMGSSNAMPDNAVLCTSSLQASRLISRLKNWHGHPWYVRPAGFEIVEVVIDPMRTEYRYKLKVRSKSHAGSKQGNQRRAGGRAAAAKSGGPPPGK